MDLLIVYSQPLLTDPKAPTPARIIPTVEKSRPPVYSPELTALLTSSVSRMSGKALEKKRLAFPATLPARADPSSEEARLLGPLSKRREVNIRWRYFTQESSRVFPPLQVIVNDHIEGKIGATKEDAIRAGLRYFGFQGKLVHEEVEAIVGLPQVTPMTRKERQMTGNFEEADSNAHRHPSRWLRRRYQNLLGRLSVLTYHSKQDAKASRYEVSRPQAAIHQSTSHTHHRLAELDSINLAWLDHAEKNNLGGKKL